MNRGGAPSRPVIDPVTLEPAGFIVQQQSVCQTCGRGSVIEVYDELGKLARREANGQLCWHWRAGQSDPEPPQTRGVDKTQNGGILKHGRR